jgi:hypothetical protein
MPTDQRECQERASAQAMDEKKSAPGPWLKC